MANFYQHDQIDIVSPFIDKFFDVVASDETSSQSKASKEPFSAEPMVSNKGKSAFFHGMLPRVGLKKSHLKRLSSLISESNEDSVFKETLRDGSELLSRSRSIRKMASITSIKFIEDDDSGDNI